MAYNKKYFSVPGARSMG